MITKSGLRKEIRDLRNKMLELYVEVDMLKEVVYKPKKATKKTKAKKASK